MLICPYCQQEAKLVTGDVVYPHRPDLNTKHFYLCAPCKAYVGCHPGTTKALGTLASSSLRHMRNSAHNQFDPLWKSKRMTRKAAYKWLGQQLGIADIARDCHIAMFDLEQCERTIALARQLRKDLANA